ncbi:unnamed protein product [Enterobius vermicularis]|uniref:MABP domain-containing protein n=1 Tax=Enterobius vermicularis TaxID=51028 RepID=A0A0N4V292_ENTVE|nr:unnamed protein product [Enterobius vermicularis]
MSDETEQYPITSVIIVSDKNKCPRGFQPITRAYDDQSDADLWKEGGFASFWSRPVRYLAVSRESPANSVGVHVVMDICIIKENDPVPSGFTAVDYTADSSKEEKSLRKKCLCIRTLPRENATDAVGEIIILNKTKKPPVNYSCAGEVDGAYICFRHVVIPATFGLAIPDRKSGGLYPSINPSAHNLSDPQLSLSARSEAPVNALTIRAGDIRKNIKDIPFKLHPLIESNCAGNRVGFFTFLLLSGSVTTLMFTFNFQENFLPEIKSYTRDMLDNLYRYEFTIERDAVRN